MPRPLKNGMAVPDLQNRIASGQRYEVTARAVGDTFFLFYRPIGEPFWFPLVDRRKVNQLTYKLGSMACMLTNMLKDLDCSFSFELDGERYSRGGQQDAFVVELLAQIEGLPTGRKNAVLALLDVPAAPELVDKILYHHYSIDLSTRDILAQIITGLAIPWPGGPDVAISSNFFATVLQPASA